MLLCWMGSLWVELYSLEGYDKGTHYPLTSFLFVQRRSALFTTVLRVQVALQEYQLHKKVLDLAIYFLMMRACYFVRQILWSGVDWWGCWRNMRMHMVKSSTKRKLSSSQQEYKLRKETWDNSTIGFPSHAPVWQIPWASNARGEI